MNAPIVGIVGYHHTVPRPFGDLPVSGAPTTYADAVTAAGGLPLLLPPDQAVELLDLVDAVVLTGGGDVDPSLYGGDPGSATDVDPARDKDELAVVRAAAERSLPFLGVCRGLQLLAVAYGGTLRAAPGHLNPVAGHDVRTAPGSLAERLLGPGSLTSALHQQAVAEPGPALRATAWAEDGTVEALEPVDPGWAAIGVQWHPELAGHPELHDPTGPAVFGWLVRATQERRLVGAAATPPPGAWFCR